ncbi:MAG: O-antigen ligase family protein [Bacteroidales bacterium]|nr:O-antigen ligase family protein [Bacteroidales bacterium]
MLTLRTNIHSTTYFVVLVLLAMSIPLSKYAMSVTQFMLLGLWLWAGFSFRISYRFFKYSKAYRGIFHFLEYLIRLAYSNIVDKFGLFFKNPAALVFVSIYLIHLIGLIHTQNFDYALKDLRVKLPILMLPVVISTMEPLSFSRFRVLMSFYILAVLGGTLISAGLLVSGNYVDIREISPFIGPIRFGLNVGFSIFALVYFAFHDRKPKLWHRLVCILLIIWFTLFLFLLESVTGMIVVGVGSLTYFFWLLLRTRFRYLRMAIVTLIVAIPLMMGLEVYHIIDEATTPPKMDFSQLDQFTTQGNLYEHDTTTNDIEDGRYVGLYVCRPELEVAWNKRSQVDYFDLTQEGYPIEATLIRYLTSKDLRKDAEGVNALTEWDIKTIEQGTANIHYIKSPGLKVRILKMLKGYDVYKKTGNPSGSSMMQRIEYVRASIGIIEKYPYTGVGTGDLDDAFNQQYREMETPLEKKYRYHAHNQFLGIAVALGLIAMLWFIFALIYPGIKTKAFNDFFFNAFFLMILISMLSDDTIETQAGATLFAFFFSILLFGRKRDGNLWRPDSKE